MMTFIFVSIALLVIGTFVALIVRSNKVKEPTPASIVGNVLSVLNVIAYDIQSSPLRISCSYLNNKYCIKGITMSASAFEIVKDILREMGYSDFNFNEFRFVRTHASRFFIEDSYELSKYLIQIDKDVQIQARQNIERTLDVLFDNLHRSLVNDRENSPLYWPC